MAQTSPPSPTPRTAFPIWVFPAVVLAVAATALILTSLSPRTNNVDSAQNLNASGNASGNADSYADVNGTANANASAEDWLVFRDPENRFIVRYPRGWSVVERTDSSMAFSPSGKLGQFPELSIKATPNTATTLAQVRRAQDNYDLTDRHAREVSWSGITAYVVSGTSATPLSNGANWLVDRAAFAAGTHIFEVAADNAREFFDAVLTSFSIP